LNGGAAANGLFDFRFSLYDAGTNGALVAGPLTVGAVPVNRGVFTASLDFGSGAFNAGDRWLEIAVGFKEAGAFTSLAPRQALTPVPMALYSASAATAAKYGGAVSSSQLTGPIPSALMPSGLLTNGATGASLAGLFSGSGAGLTNCQMPADVVGPIIGRFAPTSPLWYNTFWDTAGADPLIPVTDAGIRAIAQKWRANGMQAAGWKILWIDDCWGQAARDAHDNLQPNPTNFPSGLQSLTAYLHSLGFKAGIYTAHSAYTPAGYVGTDDAHVVSDVAWFAAQGFDAIKVDVCSSLGTTTDYVKNTTRLFSNAIMISGRDMLLLFTANSYAPDLQWSLPADCAKEANVWQDAQAWAPDLAKLVALATFCSQTNGWAQTPGHYGQLTSVPPHWDTNQLASYVSLSAICGAAMEMCDASLPPNPYVWLTNAEVLAIHQDPAAICGSVAWSNRLVELWSRPLGSQASGAEALLAVNLSPTNQTVGLPVYLVFGTNLPIALRDVWNHAALGIVTNYWTNTLAPGRTILARAWIATNNLGVAGSPGGTLAALNSVASYGSNLSAPVNITPRSVPFNWTNCVGANVTVYIDTDGTSSSGTLSINGAVVCFNAVAGKFLTISLQPGEYFTYASTIGLPASVTYKPW